MPLRIGDEDAYKPLKSCAKSFYETTFAVMAEGDADQRRATIVSLRKTVVPEAVVDLDQDSLEER